MMLFILAFGVLLLTLVCYQLERRGWVPYWIARKLLHVGAVGACALAPMLVQEREALVWLVGAAIPLLFYLVSRRKLFAEPDGRPGWGIALFPPAYLTLLLVFPYQPMLVVFPMAVLAMSDAAAGVVGKLFGNRYFQLTGDRKSPAGSTAFAITTFIILMWGEYSGLIPGARNFWQYALLAALLATALEALGSNGFDNLLIPLGMGALLSLYPDIVYSTRLVQAWVALPVGLLFYRYTVKRGSLTPDGAVAAVLMGIWVLLFAGVIWLVPLFFFFFSSTLLGRFARGKAEVTDAKHGRGRDFKQVVCNGGLFALLATLAGGALPSPTLSLALVITIAVCTSDTWASEIGIAYRGLTYDLLRWKRMPVGLSGGISLAGTLGGLAGACATAIVGNFLVYTTFQPRFIIIASFVGFFGMLLDSLIGSALQARYRHPLTGQLSEAPAPEFLLEKGRSWLDNDAVNLLSNLVASAIGYVFYL